MTVYAIAELKFTDRFPGWFNDLVQTFDCVLTGAAKYAGGIEQRGEDWARLPLPAWLDGQRVKSGGAMPGVTVTINYTVS